MMSIFNRLALSTMKVTIMSTNGRLSTNEPEDRRRVRTRQMLRNALLELIDEKGYESVTVQEITDRADLSRATFYLHFKDKDDLLVATLQAMYDDIRDALTVKEGATMQPNHVALNAFKHVQAHRKLYKVLLGERGMAAVWQRIQAYMFTTKPSGPCVGTTATRKRACRRKSWRSLARARSTLCSSGGYNMTLRIPPKKWQACTKR